MSEKKQTESLSNLIQVAGIKSLDEALMVAKNGATHIGFPLELDVHTPDMNAGQTRKVTASLPDTALPVLITYLNQAEQIKNLCRGTGCRAVQIHGSITRSELKTLFKNFKGQIIKSLVIGRTSPDKIADEIKTCQKYVDLFITDTFDPHTGASGATGLTHDWKISKKIIETAAKPVILAGGLNPDNVRAAVLQLHPAGVDAHTGLEDKNGDKNPALVQKFVNEARRGFELAAVTCPPELLKAVELFNSHAFFNCHHILEKLWLEEPGIVRDMYKGILQIGVGFYHEQNRNQKGALRLLESGLKLISNYTPSVCGLNLQKLAKQAEACRSSIAELAPGKRLNPKSIPRIEIDCQQIIY